MRTPPSLWASAASLALLTFIGYVATMLYLFGGDAQEADLELLTGLHGFLLDTGIYASVITFFKVVAAVGSWTGTAAFAVGAAGFCLWRRERMLAALVVISAIGGALLSELLKAAIGRTRPSLFADLAPVQGFAFPSGHAVSAVSGIAFSLLVVCVLLRATRWRIVLAIMALVLVALIDLSRLVLAVHWPTDVLAGNLVGAAWSATLVAVSALVVARRPIGG